MRSQGQWLTIRQTFSRKFDQKSLTGLKQNHVKKDLKWINFLENLSDISDPLSLKKPDRFFKWNQRQGVFEVKIQGKIYKNGRNYRG
jgi:hypothetical protein